MDPNLIDPSLLTIQRPPDPASWSATQNAADIAERIKHLRRLPNQIGGVTIASLHSNDTPPRHSFVNPSFTQGYQLNDDSRPPSSAFASVNNCLKSYTSQPMSLPQTTRLFSRQVSQPKSDKKYSYPTAQTFANQSIQYPQIDNTSEQSTRIPSQTVTEFPKFHCGEFGCRASRTDGLTLNGRYAMRAHYKKKHPDLKFDVTRLIASKTGQRSRRMSLKEGNEAVENNGHYQGALHGDGISPATVSIPARNDSHNTHPPMVPKFVNQAGLSVSTNGLQSQVQAQTYHGIVYTNNSQPCLEPTMPKLPRVRPRSFTDVYDLYDSPESFRSQIQYLRMSCEAEFLTARQLMLAQILATNQPVTAFMSLRKSESSNSLQEVHRFVTMAIGPSDLDARGVGLGLQGDTVNEYATIICAALQRVHLPTNGVWPDGTVLPSEETQRRFWCCELQAWKLCLFTFQRLVQNWCRRLECVAPGCAAKILLDRTRHDEDSDRQMVDGRN